MNFITQESELDTKNGLSVIYFYAPWLLFHKKILEQLQDIESILKNIKFYGIDIDQFRNLVTRFGLTSLPTILIVKDEGKIVKNIVGIRATAGFRNLIHDIYESYIKSI